MFEGLEDTITTIRCTQPERFDFFLGVIDKSSVHPRPIVPSHVVKGDYTHTPQYGSKQLSVLKLFTSALLNLEMDPLTDVLLQALDEEVTLREHLDSGGQVMSFMRRTFNDMNQMRQHLLGAGSRNIGDGALAALLLDEAQAIRQDLITNEQLRSFMNKISYETIKVRQHHLRTANRRNFTSSSLVHNYVFSKSIRGSPRNSGDGALVDKMFNEVEAIRKDLIINEQLRCFKRKMSNETKEIRQYHLRTANTRLEGILVTQICEESEAIRAHVEMI